MHTLSLTYAHRYKCTLSLSLSLSLSHTHTRAQAQIKMRSGIMGIERGIEKKQRETDKEVTEVSYIKGYTVVDTL